MLFRSPNVRFALEVHFSGCHSFRHILLKYRVKPCFSMVGPGITSERDRVRKASVIRSEIRSRAELNCALPLFLHPSHQRDTARTPTGIGRLRARRRFGYWSERIGHLREQSGRHSDTWCRLDVPDVENSMSLGGKQSSSYWSSEASTGRTRRPMIKSQAERSL